MRELTCKIIGPVHDNDLIRTSVGKCCLEAGATILKFLDHVFKPQGYTALFLLAESHAAVHTWPEKGYALVNYFSCAEDPKIDVFLRVLGECGFEAREVQIVPR